MKYIISLILINVATLAIAGNEGGHGGDPYALEFYELGQKIITALAQPEKVHLLNDTKVDLAEFKKVHASVLIYSDEAEKVTLGQQEVDAINFPKTNNVLINRSRWRDALLDQKLKLVLHEYFCFMNIECDTYNISIKYSAALIELYKSLLANRETPVRYYGRCIGNPPLYSRGEACAKDNPSVVKAVACAETQAIGNCLAEKGEGCGQVGTEITRIRSVNVIGFEYCEVNSRAK